MKSILFYLIVSSFSLLSAQTVLFRTVTSQNDASVGGTFQAKVQMRVTDGADQLLNSLTVDVSYGADLTAWPDPDPAGINWFTTNTGYLNSVSKLDGYYRILVVGDLNDIGSGNAWPVTQSWQTIVTLRWEIASLGSHDLSIDQDTDAAAFFISDPLPDPPNDVVTDWNATNTDESGQSIYTKVKLLLQGPFQPLTGDMRTVLQASSHVPLLSPYSEDPQSVSALPDNVVDWVLLQIRNQSDGSAVASKSVFLRNDGYLINPDGTTAINMPDAAGDYFIVVQHRNHLAVMTSASQSLSSNVPSAYDFTTAQEQFFGYADGDAAALLNTDIWGAFTGDADQNGTIDSNDNTHILNQRHSEGYGTNDVNLDGHVTISDHNQTFENRSRSTKVP